MKMSFSSFRIFSARCAAGLLAVGWIGAAPPAPAAPPQASYATTDEAVSALTTALKANDTAALAVIFGPELRNVISADPVERKNECEAFAKAYAEKVQIVSVDDRKAILNVGANAWPLPFPLVKGKDDRWTFDTAAGKEEILNRRIGENELIAINLLVRYVEAQREYASSDWDGSQVLCFAQRLISTPGRKDGLYWESGADGAVSPLAEVVAEARAEGYGKRKPSDGAARPYEGYIYKVLTRQGPDAPLGRYNYVINGKMIAGFALVAYPLKYGNSGIVTFIVNQQGIVYQRNLGPNTTALGAAMTEYNPGAGWKPVEVEAAEFAPAIGKK